MKKPLYILLLFLSNLAVCQEYTPLLDTYNQWSVRYCFSGCSTDVYYTNGDTIVDAMNYKVLDGYHFISRGFLLREDVTEKKVYLKPFYQVALEIIFSTISPLRLETL